MSHSLLIGNGLNQCLLGGCPWGNLLKSIADDFGLTVNNEIPMPLEFERLINVHLANNPKDAHDIYNRVKEKVAVSISKPSLPADAIHRRIKEIEPDSIITTNYDLLLEKVYNDSFTPTISKGVAGNSTRYVVKSVGRIDAVDFFHAHGCVSKPKTICLGYDHYMGMVNKINETINRTPQDKDEKVIVSVLKGDTASTNTWMEKFYTDNIYIVGLGLYECETDLWWLLTHRAKLYYFDESGMHTGINNQITYYDVIDDLPKGSDKEREKQLMDMKTAERKKLLLEGMNVKVAWEYLSDTSSGEFREAYNTIFDRIKLERVK